MIHELQLLFIVVWCYFAYQICTQHLITTITTMESPHFIVHLLTFKCWDCKIHISSYLVHIKLREIRYFQSLHSYTWECLLYSRCSVMCRQCIFDKMFSVLMISLYMRKICHHIYHLKSNRSFWFFNIFKSFYK